MNQSQSLCLSTTATNTKLPKHNTVMLNEVKHPRLRTTTDWLGQTGRSLYPQGLSIDAQPEILRFSQDDNG